MPSILNIAVVTASGSYNMEDFAPIEQEDGVNLYKVEHANDWGQPNLVLLPGTPTVAEDFDMLEERSIVPLIREHAAAGKWMFGICGGMHMMGQRLLDPHCQKYPFTEKAMLGILQIETLYLGEPVLARLRNISAPWGCTLRGYETHTGRADGTEPVLFRRADGSAIGFGHGCIMATYLHRCFDDKGFREAFLAAVRENRPV